MFRFITVDRVLKRIEKIAEQLAAVDQFHTREAERLRQQARVCEARATDSEDESKRARRVQARIAHLGN